LEARGEKAQEAELFGEEFLLERPLLQAIEASRDKARDAHGFGALSRELQRRLIELTSGECVFSLVEQTRCLRTALDRRA
jgi:hypothetical protein